MRSFTAQQKHAPLHRHRRRLAIIRNSSNCNCNCNIGSLSSSLLSDCCSLVSCQTFSRKRETCWQQQQHILSATRNSTTLFGHKQPIERMDTAGTHPSQKHITARQNVALCAAFHRVIIRPQTRLIGQQVTLSKVRPDCSAKGNRGGRGRLGQRHYHRAVTTTGRWLPHPLAAESKTTNLWIVGKTTSSYHLAITPEHRPPYAYLQPTTPCVLGAGGT